MASRLAALVFLGCGAVAAAAATSLRASRMPAAPRRAPLRSTRAGAGAASIARAAAPLPLERSTRAGAGAASIARAAAPLPLEIAIAPGGGNYSLLLDGVVW
jgi:hypothetical protein